MDYASPPRWQSLATGDSPHRFARAASPISVPSAYENQGSDNNARAIAVLRAGIDNYHRVLSSTDPATWAWSRPLWSAMFETANALADPVSQWASETIYATFNDLGNTIPCPLCVEHFRQSLSTFPRYSMTQANLLGWISQLKKEVDERARQRQLGQAQTAGTPTPSPARSVGSIPSPLPPAPVYSVPSSPAYSGHTHTSPATQRPYQTARQHSSPPPPHIGSPQPPEYHSPPRSAGYPSPPPPNRYSWPSPQRSPVPTVAYGAPPSASRPPPWEELRQYQQTYGLCMHGIAPECCELCARCNQNVFCH
ncbi:hypothetical protein DIPPA_35947 [Diplonema papillatum]|nr:hypothetical protein DIPPA_35947 [Diplonema papillatum]